MKRLRIVGADSPEDIFDPKPVGEPVVSHVEEAVQDPKADYEAMKAFIDNPDYRKVFSD
jgi:hypothetical protein